MCVTCLCQEGETGGWTARFRIGYRQILGEQWTGLVSNRN